MYRLFLGHPHYLCPNMGTYPPSLDCLVHWLGCLVHSLFCCYKVFLCWLVVSVLPPFCGWTTNFWPQNSSCFILLCIHGNQMSCTYSVVMNDKLKVISILTANVTDHQQLSYLRWVHSSSYSCFLFSYHLSWVRFLTGIESLKTVFTLKPWNSIDSWVVWASFLVLHCWSWLVECGRTFIDECTSSFCGWTTNLYGFNVVTASTHKQLYSVSMATKTTYSVVSIESHLYIHANVTDQDVF